MDKSGSIMQKYLLLCKGYTLMENGFCQPFDPQK